MFREHIPDVFLGSLQTPFSVFSCTLSLCWGLCRSFWRAAAVGEELHDDVVDQLLKVLGTGEVFSLVNQYAQSSPYIHLVLHKHCWLLAFSFVTCYLHT